MTEKTCSWCQQPFAAKSATARFCSDRHRYASRDRKRFRPIGTVVTATCRDCQHPFTYVSSTKPRLRCDGCNIARYGPGGTYWTSKSESTS